MCRQKLALFIPFLLPLVLHGDSNFQGPLSVLERADRLAMLYNWPEAAALYAQAESLFAQSGDQKNALSARLGYVWATADAAVNSAVVKEVSAYLQDPRVQVDRKLMLRTLVAKAVLDRNTNESAARELWEQILKLATTLGDERWMARAKAEIGQVLYLEGDIKSAVAMLREAILSQYLHFDFGAAIHYTAMVGNGFVEAGQPEAGLQYCNIALRASHIVPGVGFPFLAYQGKARALLALHLSKETTSVLDEALARARKEHNNFALSQLYIVAGTAAVSATPARSIDYFLEASDLSEKKGFQHVFAWSAFALARMYRDTGDLDRAETLASKAIQVVRDLEDRSHLPEDLSLLAELEAKKGNFERGDELYSEATDVIDGLLVNVTRRQLKSSLIATVSDAYVKHFELAATKFGDIDKAYRIIEEARGRVVADTLRGESESLSSSSDEISTEAQQEINRIQLALLHERNPQERQLLLDQLFAQEQLLSPVLKTRSPAKPIGDRGKPFPLRTVQASLDRDEILLEYVLGDSQSYCLRISRTDAKLIVLPAGRKRVETLVTDYESAVRSRKSEILPSEELFTLLLKPVMAKSVPPRIIVVPDGRLHLLPFDGLKTRDGKYVLESHVVTYAPSATVLHLLRRARAGSHPAPNFLGVGDVIYPRPLVKTSHASINSVSSASGAPDFFSVGVITFPDLPGSGQEIATVAGTVKGTKRLLLGPDATEATFKALPLSEFSVMHLAVHGLGNSQYPDRAALVLGSSPAQHEDGLLQVREIRDLPLRADLVTLSACDTGNGRLLGEEGVASLERAFLLAGTKAVIASLWTADDTYSIALMRRLYQHLAGGADIGSSLRQAKLDLLKEFGEQALPIYWAGFTLVGDGLRTVFRPR